MSDASFWIRTGIFFSVVGSGGGVTQQQRLTGGSLSEEDLRCTFVVGFVFYAHFRVPRCVIQSSPRGSRLRAKLLDEQVNNVTKQTTYDVGAMVIVFFPTSQLTRSLFKRRMQTKYDSRLQNRTRLHRAKHVQPKTTVVVCLRVVCFGWLKR